MQNCRDCLFSNSEMTPMLPFNTRYDKISQMHPCKAHAGRSHVIFLRAACRNSRSFALLSRDFWHFLCKFFMRSTPDAHLFGSKQPSDFTENCTDVARVVQHTLAECTHFFCERHGEISEVLQFFREIFAQILRDLDARRALLRI